MVPESPMRPNVTFRPTRPLNAEGMRTEPPVSLPMPAGVSRAATATPVPLDEPPGVRCVFEVPGIPRRAHQRIGAPAAEGELDHVQLAERHHAGGGQPLDRVGGLGGDALLEHLGAAGADAAGDVAQILVGDGQAMQRPERKAAGARLVGAVGHRLGLLGVDLGEGVQLAVRLGDAAEQGVDDVA